MLEVLASIVLEQIVPSVLNEVVSILAEKLRQKLRGTTPGDTTPQVQIEDAVIKEKIEQLIEQNEGIQDYIQNHNETTEHLIQEILSEIKRLSAQMFELEVGNDQIGLSEAIQEQDREVNLQNLTARLEEIQKSIEKNIKEYTSTRLEEIQKKPSLQVKNKPVLESAANEDNVQKISSDANEKNSVKVNPESLEILENLNKYKEYGESVLKGIETLERNQSEQDEGLSDSGLQECLASLKIAAKKTVEQASSPAKIAITGEFSSGKTQLIDSLIGYSGVLPVSENPTTGNITAIHLSGEDDFKTTEFAKFEVEYLSEQEVIQCLKFMFGEAKKRAQSSEFLDLPQVNEQILNEETLKSYEDWCQQAWNKTQNLQLRNLLQELVIFIRTCISYKTDLCNKSFEIDKTITSKGLELDSVNNKNKTNTFEHIPQVTKVSVDKKQASAELLQNSFSLIRRINIHVKISKHIWNLGSSQDSAKFILLDFPGLGAASSGVRDKFVSQQELKSVQTILILVNGATPPGGDLANQTLTMTQEILGSKNLEDRILVGVGRFNELRLDEPKLDELINSPRDSSLTETTVFGKIRTLETIIENAKRLGSKQEIVLLDQLMGLKKLADRSTQIQVGSSKFLANLGSPNFLEKSKQISQKWGDLSKRLLAADSNSSLGKQLDDFASDGGIGKLRELLLEHVAAHGLKQLYEDTRKDADNLRQQQDKLKEILSNQGILKQESQDLQNLRSHLQSMYSEYKTFKDKQLGKELLKDRQEIAVRDVVKDEVTYRILDWKQWNLLFNKAKNGRITLPSPKGNKTDLPTRRRPTSDSIPTKTDDFYSEFDNTLKELQKFAKDCIQKAVDKLLNDLSNLLSVEINHLQTILDEEMLKKIENQERFGDREYNIFVDLIDYYDPKKWEQYIIKRAFEEEEHIETASAFPLARQDEKHNHNRGQILSWAPEYSQINPQNSDESQLLLVQRLRDEINASTSLQLIEYVSEVNEKVKEAILVILDRLIPLLNDLLKNNVLLRYIADGELNANEDNFISQILSEITQTPIPNK